MTSPNPQQEQIQLLTTSIGDGTPLRDDAQIGDIVTYFVGNQEVRCLGIVCDAAIFEVPREDRNALASAMSAREIGVCRYGFLLSGSTQEQLSATGCRAALTYLRVAKATRSTRIHVRIHFEKTDIRGFYNPCL